MRLPRLPPSGSLDELPLWPPLLAARGPGGESALHAHHAMHVVVAVEGLLAVRTGAAGVVRRAAGVLTGPDVLHAIDARGREVLLVFLDPESSAGSALRTALDGPIALLDRTVCDALLRGSDPSALMHADGVVFTDRLVTLLGASPVAPRMVHPRVRALLRHLARAPAEADTSLEALADAVGLSAGRLMHAFTASIGVPLRPYLAWLRTQRAAAAISGGASLTQAAHAAGFSDAAHMTRTFRRTFGIAPRDLRAAG